MPDTEKIDKQQLLDEIVSLINTGVDLALLPDPDVILKKRGESADDVLDDVYADTQVSMAMSQRKAGTLFLPDYGFKPGALKGQEPDQKAVDLADRLNAELENMDVYNINEQLLDTPFWGLTPAELMFSDVSGSLMLSDVKIRERKYFAYNTAGEALFKSKDAPDGIIINPHKIIISRHSPSVKNPYGVRLGARCLWAVVGKKLGIRFLSDLIEKFGSETIIGKKPPTTGDDRKDKEVAEYILAQYMQIRRNSVAVIPADAEYPQILGINSKADSTNMHTAYIQMWDNAISKVLVGQTMTGELGSVGARATSETGYKVLDNNHAADQQMLRSFWNEVSWAYTQVNAPDVLSPVWDWDIPTDRKALADLSKTLKETGVAFTKVYYVRNFGLAEDEFDIAPAQTFAPAAQFASPRSDSGIAVVKKNQAMIDKFGDKIMPKAISAANQRTQQIVEMFNKMSEEDFQKIREGLKSEKDKLISAMPGDDFETLLAECFLAAKGAGRQAVNTEIGEDAAV